MTRGIQVSDHDKKQSRWYDRMGQVFDGYHTFDELYDFRKAYNALLFNEWSLQNKYKTHKSWHHSDAPYKPIFGGGWFVVVAETPVGQITNHYEAKDWNLFQVSEAAVAHAWDGHTPQEALERLVSLASFKDKENPNAKPATE